MPTTARSGGIFSQAALAPINPNTEHARPQSFAPGNVLRRVAPFPAENPIWRHTNSGAPRIDPAITKTVKFLTHSGEANRFKDATHGRLCAALTQDVAIPHHVDAQELYPPSACVFVAK
jgi:hypothetical protein